MKIFLLRLISTYNNFQFIFFIFILEDLQALFSAAILDDVLRNRPSIYQKLDELSKGKAEIAVEIEVKIFY